MRHEDPLSSSELVTRMLSRVLKSLTLHPVFLLVLLAISIWEMEIVITETPLTFYKVTNTFKGEGMGDRYASEMNLLVRWLDLSMLISSHRILLYCLGGLISICGAGILISLILALKSKTPKISINNYYLIQGSLYFSYVLSYAGLTTIVRTCVYAYGEIQNGIGRVMTVFLLCFYILIVYVLPLLFINDHSWHTSKVTSHIHLFNPLTIYNILRLVITLVLITANFQHYQQIEDPGKMFPVFTFVFSLLFLALMGYSLWKDYLIIPVHNEYMRMMLSACLYLFLVRIAEICWGQSFRAFLVMIGAVLSMFSMRLLDEKIMNSMIKRVQPLKEKEFIEKINFIWYHASKIASEDNDQHRNYLDRFLCEHMRYCSTIGCKCTAISEYTYSQNQQQQKIDEQHQKIITTNKQKIKQSKSHKSPTPKLQKIQNNFNTLKNKREEERLWSEFIYDMLDEKIQFGSLMSLSIKEKQEKIEFYQQIILLKVYIAYKYLGKLYYSYGILKFMVRQVRELGKMEIYFQSEVYSLMDLIEIEIGNKIEKLQAIECHERFIDLQLKIITFRRMICKVANKCIQFWKEIYDQKSDSQKVVSFVHELNKRMIKVRSYYTKLSQIYNFTEKDDYCTSNFDQSWNKKVKKVIDEFYIPFLCAFDDPKSDSVNIIKCYDDKTMKKKEERMKKLMDIYDSDSRVPMCLIDVNEGDTFGKICNANKQFRPFTQNQNKQKTFIKDFLMDEFAETHQTKMLSFLQNDNYELPPLRTFLRISDVHYKEVDFYGTMFSDLINGFKFSIFWEEIYLHPATILVSDISGVAGYTPCLQGLIEYSEGSHDEIIEIFSELSKESQMKLNQEQMINVNGKLLKATYFHKINILVPNSCIKCFSITGDDVDKLEPMVNKNSKKIYDVLEDSYGFMKRKSTYYQEEAIFYDNQVIELKEVIENDKKCKSVTRWFKCNIALFSIIGVMALWSIISAYVNIETLYRVMYNCNLDYSKLYISLIDIPFQLRRLNVLGYEKSKGISSQIVLYFDDDDQQKKYEVYQEALEMDLQIIQDTEDKLVFFNWGEMIRGFNFKDGWPSTQEQVTFEVLKNRFVLSSAAYLGKTNISALAFDYLLKEIQQPLPEQAENLFNIIYNTNYIFLPILRNSFRQFFDYTLSYVFNNFAFSIVNFATVINITICLALFTYGITINSKIKNISFLSFSMFQSLKISLIKNREINFTEFQKNLLPETLQRKPVKSTPEEIQRRKKIRKTQSSNSMVPVLKLPRKKVMSSDFTNSSRGILDCTQKQNIIDQNETEQKKEKNGFQMKRVDNRKQNALIFVRLTPLVLLSILAYMIQSRQDTRMKDLINVSVPLQQKIQNTLLMRNLILELPLQYQNLTAPYQSLANKRFQILDQLIQKNSEFQQRVNTSKFPQIYKRSNQIKSAQFCATPLIIPPSGRPENVNKQCNDKQNEIFNGKSTDQLFIYLVNKARYTISQMNVSSDDTSYKRSLLESREKYLYEQMSSYQYRTGLYFRQALEIDFNQSVQEYFLAIIAIETTILLVLIIIAIYWLKKLRETLYNEISTVKMVFKLISFNAIQTDPQLKAKIDATYDKFMYLA